MPFRLGEQRLRIIGMAHQRNHTAIMRAPVRGTGQRTQQLLVVAPVLPVASAAAWGCGVTRRMHAGFTVECRHAHAGIIRQRRQAGGAAGMPRLGQRILDKRAMRFIGFAHAKRTLRHHLDRQRREDGADLAQLARIIGSDDEFFHFKKAKTLATEFTENTEKSRIKNMTPFGPVETLSPFDKLSLVDP